MTDIDFYVLASNQTAARQHFACRLAHKAWSQNRQVYLHCASEAEAEQIDELLWSFRPDAFLPHALHQTKPNEVVVCGWEDDPSPHQDLLINLCNEVPAFYKRFKRLAEILVDHESVLAPARQRFRFYREQGYAPKTHQLRTAG